MITLRIADINDAGLIADISRETFYDTFAIHNSEKDMEKFLADQFSRELLMEQVGAAGNHFILAYEAGHPVGYVFLSEGSNKTLGHIDAIEICRLYARNAYIGKGIGKQLMNACIAFAQSLNKECLWLGVWENNHRAINFYHSFGFTKFGEHDFILGDDVQVDWGMCLRVTGKEIAMDYRHILQGK